MFAGIASLGNSGKNVGEGRPHLADGVVPADRTRNSIGGSSGSAFVRPSPVVLLCVWVSS